jgi:hypothetical protein
MESLSSLNVVQVEPEVPNEPRYLRARAVVLVPVQVQLLAVRKAKTEAEAEPQALERTPG